MCLYTTERLSDPLDINAWWSRELVEHQHRIKDLGDG